MKTEINISDITHKLKSYELVKDIYTLRQLDNVKYIRKDNGSFVNNKIIISGDKKNNTLLLQGYNNFGKRFTYTIQISDIILFRKIDEVGLNE